MNRLNDRIQGGNLPRRSTLILASIALLAFVSAAPLMAERDDDDRRRPHVLPPHSHPHGKSYGEWAADWWQWAYGIPVAQNPVIDPTGEFCDVGQQGPVWFLAGAFGGTVVRQCTVPAGKGLFFPLFNTVWVQFPDDPPFTIDELREILRQFQSTVSVSCEIDGVPVQNPENYVEESAVFTLTIPDDDVYRLPAGTYYPCLDRGFYLMLTPLPVGQHTIHLHGERVRPNGTVFVVDVTYHLTIAP